MSRFRITNDQVFVSLQSMNMIGEKEPSGTLGLKFARMAKRLRDEAVLIQKSREQIQLKFARRYPPDHERAGQPMPKFRPGTPVDQRTPDNTQAIIPGEFDIDNEYAAKEELKEIGLGLCELELPQITERDIEQLAKLGLKPNVIEPLLWNVDGTGLVASDDADAE